MVNRKQLKERARDLISQDRGYYFKLTLLPALLQFMAIVAVVLLLSADISSLFSDMNPLKAMQLAYSLLATLLSISVFFALIKIWFDFSMKMMMLRSYRKDKKPKKVSKAITYVFTDSKWLYVIGLLIVTGIYTNIVNWITELFVDLVATIMSFGRIAANNQTLSVILVVVYILIAIVLNIISVLFLNVNEQIAYAYLDSYDIGEGVFYTFKKAFVLMTKKENMLQFFYLQLSFLGWYILNTLTLGILGICWFNAYAEMTYAGFYDEITKKED